MDKVEEILPGISNYLKKHLARENLTPQNEKKRLDYVEKIDFALEQQRRGISAAGEEEKNSSIKKMIPNRTGNAKSLPSIPDVMQAIDSMNENKTDDFGAYEDIPGHPISPSKSELSVLPKEQYEECFIFGTADSVPVPSIASPASPDSDEDSETDYESIGEADDKFSPPPGEYVRHDKSSSPRFKPNSSKINSAENISVISANLVGTTFKGDLFQKGKMSWRRRFCAICLNDLICCENERDLKLVKQFSLSGYDVDYRMNNQGKMEHELRLSCPGRKTHFFYVESKEKAQQWVKELRRAAGSIAKTSLKSPEEKKSTLEQDIRALREYSPMRAADDQDVQYVTCENPRRGSLEKTKDDKRNKSKIQNFIRKVRVKVKPGKANSFTTADLDSDLAGYFNVCDASTKKWTKRYCVVKDGHLICYKTTLPDERPEMTMKLRGAHYSTKSGDEGKKDCTIRLFRDGVTIFLELNDPSERRRWVQMLSRETAVESPKNRSFEEPPQPQGLTYPDPEYSEVHEYQECQIKRKAPPLPVFSPKESPPPASIFWLPFNESNYLDPMECRPPTDNNLDEKPFETLYHNYMNDSLLGNNSAKSADGANRTSNCSVDSFANYESYDAIQSQVKSIDKTQASDKGKSLLGVYCSMTSNRGSATFKNVSDINGTEAKNTGCKTESSLVQDVAAACRAVMENPKTKPDIKPVIVIDKKPEQSDNPARIGSPQEVRSSSDEQDNSDAKSKCLGTKSTQDEVCSTKSSNVQPEKTSVSRTQSDAKQLPVLERKIVKSACDVKTAQESTCRTSQATNSMSPLLENKLDPTNKNLKTACEVKITQESTCSTSQTTNSTPPLLESKLDSTNKIVKSSESGLQLRTENKSTTRNEPKSFTETKHLFKPAENKWTKNSVLMRNPSSTKSKHAKEIQFNTDTKPVLETKNESQEKYLSEIKPESETKSVAERRVSSGLKFQTETKLASSETEQTKSSGSGEKQRNSFQIDFKPCVTRPNTIITTATTITTITAITTTTNDSNNNNNNSSSSINSNNIGTSFFALNAPVSIPISVSDTSSAQLQNSGHNGIRNLSDRLGSFTDSSHSDSELSPRRTIARPTTTDKNNKAEKKNNLVQERMKMFETKK